MCDTYNCDHLPHTIFGFYFIDFQLNTDLLPNLAAFFTVKSPGVTQRSVSQENDFKRSKNLSAFFFRKVIGSNNSFTLIENNFRFLR